ncbi:GtrA family protein [Polymorphobacter fuscus]|nr:GtrA family protein [Polymorphobacter fuscus]NJC08581.1 putative flippase GtrA [Polymorphobacter fuscus]
MPAMTSALRLGNPALRQFVRFGIVGVANTAVCLAVVWTAQGVLGVPVWLAGALGYGVAMVQSYLVNRNWTFAGGGTLPVGSQVVRFILVNIVMGTIFSVSTDLLAPQFGVRPASLIVIVPLTVLSFLATKFFVFGRGSRA